MNLVVNSHEVYLARVGSRSHIGVSQTLTAIQLCKSHDSKLLGASQAPHARIAPLARHDARKACPWSEELHDLSNKGLANIHRKPSMSLSFVNYSGMAKRVLNRHQIKLASRLRQCWHSLQINPV